MKRRHETVRRFHMLGLILQQSGVSVRRDGYTPTETEGEMYFCNARCLCIWTVQLATHSNLADGRHLPGVQLTQPTGEQRTFADVENLQNGPWRTQSVTVPNSLSDH
jgi:hypothetical protein